MPPEPERRPITVEFAGGVYRVKCEGEPDQAWTEDELRWFCTVVGPAALPPLPVPGLAGRRDG